MPLFHRVFTLIFLSFGCITAGAGIVTVKNDLKREISLYTIDNFGFGKPIQLDANEAKKVNFQNSIWVIVADSNQFFSEVFGGESLTVRQAESLIFLQYSGRNPQINSLIEFYYKNGIQLRKSVFSQNKFVNYSPDREYEAQLKLLTAIENNYNEEVINRFKTILFELKCISFIENNQSTSRASWPLPIKDSLLSYVKFINAQDRKPYNIFQDKLAKLLFEFLRSRDKQEALSIILDNFKGDTKDFLLAHQAKLVGEKQRNNLYDAYRYVGKICNLDFKNELISKLKSKTHAQIGAAADIFLDEKGKNILLDSLLKQIGAGDIVIMDFWASWCVPCQREGKIMVSKLLEADLKNLQVFSINMDATSDDWLKNPQPMDAISKAIHLVGDFSSHFAKKFDITSIPRYILLDKSGKVLDADFIFPSNPEFIEKLRNQIKQHAVGFSDGPVQR